MGRNLWFAQESSTHPSPFAYLYEMALVSGMALGEQVEIDAPRTAVGTVPGTVPGAIQIASRIGVWTAILWLIAGPNASGTATAIVSLNPEGTARLVRKVIWRPICAATRGATPAAIPKSVPNAVCAAIRRPTFAAPQRTLRRKVKRELGPQDPNPVFTLHSSLFTISSRLALPGLAPIMAQASRADIRYQENSE
jgi:hypothetical protein